MLSNRLFSILVSLISPCAPSMQEGALCGSAKRRRSGASGATVMFDTEAVCYSPRASGHKPGIAAIHWTAVASAGGSDGRSAARTEG
jgi:hypothetical protein